MDQHSKMLATSHRLIEKRTPDQLLLRLAANERKLLEVHNLLTQSLKDDYPITPAGEWLLDNFYLIEEQIRLSRKHLPKLYSEGLPQLSNKESQGLPRVYDIALEIISHSDGRLDMETVDRFMKGYQEISHLQIGELWAVPIMLRLALIENLRRVSARIARDRTNRNLADLWASQMIKAAEHEPKSLILVIADMARSNPPLERAFVAELTRQLRGRGPALSQGLTWLEERLGETGQTSSELVQAENQNQAADQLSVSNSINSFRTLGSMDWKSFVEDNSIVEHILRKDKIYAQLDFSTRDQYRHSIERIAKITRTAEEQVADIAMGFSIEHKDNPRQGHVGYYLIDDGLFDTENASKLAFTFKLRLRRFFGRHPLATYLFSILILTLLAAGAVTWQWKVPATTWL
jgi:cyclic beta-1,2-glucan synthetase